MSKPVTAQLIKFLRIFRAWKTIINTSVIASIKIIIRHVVIIVNTVIPPP